jgi:aromatic-L-amino-acid decarboxylase
MQKAAMIAGLGSANLRLIKVDDAFALQPAALEQALTSDLAAGRRPFFVMATVGTTSSTALDPLRPIGELCRRHSLWLHVDAAMSGSAAVCPELRYIHDGLEYADSYCFNPHKWLGVNFDCDCFYVADRATLIRTLSILPEYLRNQATDAGAVIDYRDWHVQLGRRFRALKLWFVIRSQGAEGLRALVRRHVELARQFASWVAADARWELAAPVPLNLVCFRQRGGDEVNQRIMAEVNASGRMFLTHTKLRERFTLRMSIGGLNTERRHVERAWELLRGVGG